MKHLQSILFLAALLCGFATKAQNKPVNYDENKVPNYQLPDVLLCSDGTRVDSRRQWERKRRPEILEMFQSQMFGRTPHEKIPVSYEPLNETTILDGKATAKEVIFHFENNGRKHDATLLLVLPSHPRWKKMPVLFMYNFYTNKATLPGEADFHRWDYEQIVDRGYALATMHYFDIYPDDKAQRGESIQTLFSDYSDHPLSDAWGSIGTWAWGASRVADYLEMQPWVDKTRMAILGWSRLGKTALWAGAQDKRFSVVVSNESGCGGAALSRRCFGETLEIINTSFPHWFCDKFKEYNNHEADLPFDQHELIALMAPRAVYVGSAEMDDWADQKGEFLAASHAEPVYRLYGLKGLGTSEMPGLHQPIMHSVGYHIRQGIHDVTSYDWHCYLDFCRKHFGK